jgi:hypothetical protein
MDAGRFASLSRSLEPNSRRGALRALGILGTVGLVDRLGVTATEARKKKGGKKKGKKDCPECICPPTVTCPPLDHCPARVCCECKNSSGISCRYAAIGTNSAENAANCQAVCADFGAVTDVHASSPGESVACSTTNDSCVRVGCPG